MASNFYFAFILMHVKRKQKKNAAFVIFLDFISFQMAKFDSEKSQLCTLFLNSWGQMASKYDIKVILRFTQDSAQITVLNLQFRTTITFFFKRTNNLQLNTKVIHKFTNITKENICFCKDILLIQFLRNKCNTNTRLLDL